MNSLAFALADKDALVRSDRLSRLAERLVAESPSPEAWEQHPSDTWTMFKRTATDIPLQGWKLHISATPRAALAVAEAVLPILLERDCSFKMISTLNLLVFLNAAHSSRGVSGKFITIYPQSDEQAVLLAQKCDQATNSLEGPVILSDRPVRPGSLVHYRYGGFIANQVYRLDGSREYVIFDPEGRPVPDNRKAWFTVPSWTADPFLSAEYTPTEESPQEIVLDQRFEVVGAIRHSNKGGVYKAIDRRTGETVVLKEARPKVGMDQEGRDVTDRLSIEHRNLQILSALGVSPRPLAFFTYQGHRFLAMEIVEGQSLTSFVSRYRSENTAPLAHRKLRKITLACAKVLSTCHGAGIVLRDFSPNNLMLLPDDSVLFLDPELACNEGEEDPIALGAGTPGYVSPEQWNRGRPSKSDDCFSMGCLIYYLATLRDPLLAEEDAAAARSPWSRLRGQLELMIRDGLVPMAIRELVHGCMTEDVSERWTAAQILQFVETMDLDSRHTTQRGISSQLRLESILSTARDIVNHVIESLDFENRERPLKSSCLGGQTDPGNIQYGVAGAGLFLTQMVFEVEEPQKLQSIIQQAASWTLDNMISGSDKPSGLYFGQAGAVWFVLEASQALEDKDLLEAACRSALTMPRTPELLDITHGAAGTILMFLRLLELTHDQDILGRAEWLGQVLLESGEQTEHGLVWPARQDSSAESSSRVFYGFAHGVAGIVYALLALHCATGNELFLQSSLSGGETLIRNAEIDKGLAYWSHGPDQKSRWPHWCNGSSGVGTTLLRLYQVVGDERYLELAKMAAKTVVNQRWWHGSCGQCHGLAGNGEFLLDLHSLTGDESFLSAAYELTEVIMAQSVQRGGKMLFADDTQFNLSPDYAIGTSGIGMFLHRLVRGGPRALMIDSLLRPVPRELQTVPKVSA